VHEVHVSIVVVVVEGTLGLVDGQHLVVDAQPVALSVRVAEHARLQQLVVAEADACVQQRARKLITKAVFPELPLPCSCMHACPLAVLIHMLSLCWLKLVNRGSSTAGRHCHWRCALHIA
jgi:hypothetical protein